MSKNLKRILLASVGSIVFAGAGEFERKRSRGTNTALARLLLFATLLFITSVATAAADMRADQFVTMTDATHGLGLPMQGFRSTRPSCQSEIRGCSERVPFVSRSH